MEEILTSFGDLPLKSDIHHNIPQEFRSLMQRYGIDIDEQQHLSLVPRIAHTSKDLGLHNAINAYNTEWRNFLFENPTELSKGDILQFKAHMIKRNGLDSWQRAYGSVK